MQTHRPLLLHGDSAVKNSTRMLRALEGQERDHDTLVALADALSEEGADRKAAQVRREAQVRRGAAVNLTRAQEARVRKAAGESRCPVRVIYGSEQAPRVTGDRGHNVFKGSGGLVKFPGKAMAAGYRIVYVASTMEVTVGVLWLLKEGYKL